MGLVHTPIATSQHLSCRARFCMADRTCGSGPAARMLSQSAGVLGCQTARAHSKCSTPQCARTAKCVPAHLLPLLGSHMLKDNFFLQKLDA